MTQSRQEIHENITVALRANISAFGITIPEKQKWGKQGVLKNRSFEVGIASGLAALRTEKYDQFRFDMIDDFSLSPIVLPDCPPRLSPQTTRRLPLERT